MNYDKNVTPQNNDKLWVRRDQYGDSAWVNMGLRTSIAYNLISSNITAVACRLDGEDTAGRQKMALQTPDELVDRCFAIADRFVEIALQRDELQAVELTKLEKTA